MKTASSQSTRSHILLALLGAPNGMSFHNLYDRVGYQGAVDRFDTILANLRNDGLVVLFANLFYHKQHFIKVNAHQVRLEEHNAKRSDNWHESKLVGDAKQDYEIKQVTLDRLIELLDPSIGLVLGEIKSDLQHSYEHRQR